MKIKLLNGALYVIGGGSSNSKDSASDNVQFPVEVEALFCNDRFAIVSPSELKRIGFEGELTERCPENGQPGWCFPRGFACEPVEEKA